MRIPDHEHTSRAWRIHEIAPDFRVEDVWELPGSGDPHDFRLLVERLAGFDPSRSASFAVRNLMAIRLALGKMLSLDSAASGLDGRARSLRDRLPDDLRGASTGPPFVTVPFRTVYLLDDEWAAEAANSTMHGVIHLGLVRDTDGTARVRLAILVRPNGVLGRAYMALIKPFRHLLVYPPLLDELGRAWRRRGEPVS